jgi:hypothetical protein
MCATQTGPVKRGAKSGGAMRSRSLMHREGRSGPVMTHHRPHPCGVKRWARARLTLVHGASGQGS